MQDQTISSNLEDYLEAIAVISAENDGHAHTKLVAERLGVTTSSVSAALQSLSLRGLISYTAQSPAVLTATGAERAAVISRRHVQLRRFFTEILKLDVLEADQTACRVEHTIAERVMSRLSTLADAIAERDDCAPLREYLQQTMPQIKAEENAVLVPLSELPEGAWAVVGKVDSALRGLKKFADLGLVKGTRLQMEGRAPFGDLLRIKVMGSDLSLRKRDARLIWVKPTE